MNYDLKTLKSNDMPGLFISLEGLEGAGKSTQIKKIQDYLESNGKNILQVREPGSTDFGEKLRKTMLESSVQINNYAQATLFASARAQLLEEKILPFIKNTNNVVISDRHIDSSLVYQGLATDLGLQAVINLHNCYPLNILPDKTFFIDISVECSIERMKKRSDETDYFEEKGKDFFNSLRDGFHFLAKIFPERLIIINGENSEEDVHSEIVRYLK